MTGEYPTKLQVMQVGPFAYDESASLAEPQPMMMCLALLQVVLFPQHCATRNLDSCGGVYLCCSLMGFSIRVKTKMIYDL